MAKRGFDGGEIPHLVMGEELCLVPAVARDLVPLRSVSPAAKRFITKRRRHLATARQLSRNDCRQWPAESQMFWERRLGRGGL